MLDLAPQGNAVDTQHFCRLHLVSIADFKHIQNMCPFHLGQGPPRRGVGHDLVRLRLGQHALRQQALVNHLSTAQCHGAFQNILELPDITREWVAEQMRHRRIGKLRQRFAHPVCMPGEEMRHENRQIILSFAQRRDFQSEHIESEVKILAQRAGADRLRRMAIGRRQYPDIRFDHLAAAQAQELALLQHAQQFDLDRRRHFSHLVEEQRAALGQFEEAGLGRMGPGECAALMAK